MFLDSIKSAKHEIGILFPNFNIDIWYKEDEKLFAEGNVEYIKEGFLHVPKRIKR